MKNKKLALVAMMIASAAAVSFAQKVEFHGTTDYSSFIGGYATKDGGGEWEKSDIYATFGNWDGGKTQVDMKVTANKFKFVLGVRLGADLGYLTDSSGKPIYGDYVPFYQGNMTVDLFDSPVKLYVGKFEDEGFGYTTSSLAWAESYSNYIATSDYSQYFTGLEYQASAYVDGLSVIAGFPVQAASFNDGIGRFTSTTKTDVEQNSVDNDEVSVVGKAFKAGLRYKAPFGVTLMALYQGANYAYSTYNSSTKTYTYYTYDKATDKFREASLSFDVPDLLKTGIALRGGYDWQQRLADETAIKHNAFLSASMKPVKGLLAALDLRSALATGAFDSAANTIMLYQAKTKVTYDLGKKVMVGLQGNVNYMTDSSGKIGVAEVDGDSGDLGFTVNNYALALPTTVTSGYTGASFGYGLNPYIRQNFSNGYVGIGFLCQMNSYTSINKGSDAATNSAFTYAIPVNVCFWF